MLGCGLADRLGPAVQAVFSEPSHELAVPEGTPCGLETRCFDLAVEKALCRDGHYCAGGQVWRSLRQQKVLGRRCSACIARDHDGVELWGFPIRLDVKGHSPLVGDDLEFFWSVILGDFLVLLHESDKRIG